MRTVRVKQKKREEDKKDWGGMIIGLFFLAFLIGAIYFVADKFASVDVDENSLNGDWTISNSEKAVSEHWVFSSDVARHYSYDNNTNTIVEGSDVSYKYKIVLEEGKTQKDVVLVETIRGVKVPEPIKDGYKVLKRIRFSKLSKVEADVFFLYGNGSVGDNAGTDKSVTARMTKPLF